MEIDIEAATASSPPSAQAIAALGLAASLMESLLRGGSIRKLLMRSSKMEPRTSKPCAPIARRR